MTVKEKVGCNKITQTKKLSSEEVYKESELNSSTVTNLQYVRKGYERVSNEEKQKRPVTDFIRKSKRGHYKSQQSNISDKNSYVDTKSLQITKESITQKQKQQKKYSDKKKKRFLDKKVEQQLEQFQYQQESLKERCNRRINIRNRQQSNNVVTKQHLRQIDKLLIKTINRKRERDFQKKELRTLFLKEIESSQENIILLTVILKHFQLVYDKQKQINFQQNNFLERIDEKESILEDRNQQLYLKHELKQSNFRKKRSRYQRQRGYHGSKSGISREVDLLDRKNNYRKKKISGEVRSLVGLRKEDQEWYPNKLSIIKSNRKENEITKTK